MLRYDHSRLPGAERGGVDAPGMRRRAVLRWLGMAGSLVLLHGCTAETRPASGTTATIGERPRDTMATPKTTPSAVTPATVSSSPIVRLPAPASPTGTPTQGIPGPATPTTIRIGPPLILTGHTGPVGVLAWSPDGSRFATTSGVGNSPDNTIRLWNADGQPIVTREARTLVRALAWSPDGRLLASGTADGTVQLWDATGAPRATFTTSPDALFSLAWPPDGRLLAVGSIARQAGALPGVVRLIRPDGLLLATLYTEATGGKFLHLAWSSDGTLLVAGAIDFRLWRPDGTLVAALAGGVPAPAMALSSTGQLAIGDENGDLAFYDSRGQSLANLRLNGPIADVAFSADGRTLATITDGFVGLVNTERPRTGPRVIFWQAGGSSPWSVSNLAWSPDGGRLAVATRDGVLRLWHADGTPLAIYEGCPGIIERITWSPNGAALVAGSREQRVCLWRTQPPGWSRLGAGSGSKEL